MKIKLRAWALLATGLLHLAALAWLIWPPSPQPIGPPQLVSLRIVPEIAPQQARLETPKPRAPAVALAPALAPAPQPAPVPVLAPVELAAIKVAVASVEPAPAAPPQPLAALVSSPAASPEPAHQPAYQPARPPGRDCTERGLARHYPRLLRERGIEGRVLLQVRVDEQGQPAEIRVADGSGWRLLDEAARLLTQGCRFVPARRGEQTLASWIEYPVRFALKDASDTTQ